MMWPLGLVRLNAFLVLLAASAIAGAVVGGYGESSDADEPVPVAPKVDRIAYAGLDGQIRTVAPDGSDARTISPSEGVFTWPTWSPDGRRVLFSGVTSRSSAEPRVSLYAFDSITGQVDELHVREPGIQGLVARDAPHYTIWAPDARRFAFIGNSTQGLTLYLGDVEDVSAPVPIMDRGPMYVDWSPDSRHLLVHRGLEHLTVDARSGEASPMAVDSRGIGYRAPAWMPSEEGVTFVSGDESGRYGLYTSGVDARDQTLVDAVPDGVAFTWSPDGQYLAVADPERVLFYDQMQLWVYGHISLFREGAQRHPVELQEDVVAFFWSPDSTRLAYVTLTRVPGVLRWNILAVEDGERWRLVDFLPSSDQATVFQFFDQFARSHTIWSPDSESIVIAGSVAGGALSASVGRQAVSSIAVIGVERLPTVDVIADGTLGFWSPR